MNTTRLLERLAALGVLALAAGVALAQKVDVPAAQLVASGKALDEVTAKIVDLGPVALPDPEPAFSARVQGKVNVITPRGVDAAVFLRAAEAAFPTALAEAYKERQRLTTTLASVVQEARKGKVSEKTQKELTTASAALLKRLNDQVDEVSTTEYIGARRWLYRINAAIKSAGLAKLGDELALAEQAHKAKTAAELVQVMKANKLKFAVVLHGEEGSYQELYRALGAYYRKLSKAKGK